MAASKTNQEIVSPPLSTRLIQIAHKIQKKREAFLTDHGLLLGHDDLLLAIGNFDGITMGALSKKLDISASSTTKIANKLEKRGLLHRKASRLDTRQNHASLTKDGKILAAKIHDAYSELDTELTKNLKSKDLEKIFKILDRLENQKGSKKPKKPVNKHLKSSSKKTKKNKSKTG